MLAPDSHLGPYQIVKAIGSGGMGQVYEARDTRLGRRVAIKVVSEKFSERFIGEARAVAALNHPHICTLYDIGSNYLVMEFVEGAPLRGSCRSTRRVNTRCRLSMPWMPRTARASCIAT